jgi:hypothetical protein
MAYTGNNVTPVQITSMLNENSVDPKSALRISQNLINSILKMMSDPNANLVIDGNVFTPAQKFNAAATLLLNNKMEQLSNQTTSITTIFSELYKLEKSITG